MFNNLTLLLANTGDNGKPLLIAICLIVSIILSVVLFITGRSDKDDDSDSDEE